MPYLMRSKKYIQRLAIDSALRPTSLALQQGDNIIARTLDDTYSGAENLVSEIKNFIKKNNMNFNTLDEIVVSAGPGPFIGLRVGIAAAFGISLAAKKPIKSISTFLALASFAETKNNENIIMVHQKARKNYRAFQTFDVKLNPLSELSCLEDEAFDTLCQKHDNICFAPSTPPSPLSKRLLTLTAFAQAYPQPIYPPYESTLETKIA